MWLKEGDRNTLFFHARATERRHRKEIKSLKMIEGAVVVGSIAIQRIILEYFSNIFSSTRLDGGVIDEIVACLELKLSEAMHLELLSPFTSEEASKHLMKCDLSNL
ncbi:UNVERIFIED_CONTAM: hypothetical protein Slati_0402100 [Sesamum latifolium]|uniref:Uncharacterized protein n=1 Tax=Sesamum latifolium TaxID=2727402 RepID=A0AAW2XUV3_9LAMI